MIKNILVDLIECELNSLLSAKLYSVSQKVTKFQIEISPGVFGLENQFRYFEKLEYVVKVHSLSSGKVAATPILKSVQGGLKNGRRALKFSGKTGMHEKSRVSSTTKYNCFKLDGSGNCIIRKTWMHCI